MPGPPLVRARHPQTLLALLADRHPEVHPKVMASLRCGPSVSQALPVQWLPVEFDIEVMEVVTRALPRKSLDELISHRQRKEMGSALFKSFVATVTRLFGLSPATVLRNLDRGWRQLLVDCGTIEVLKLEPRSGLAMLRGLPAMCVASDPWIDALAPGMRVLYELVKASGEVTVTRRGDDIELLFAW